MTTLSLFLKASLLGHGRKYYEFASEINRVPLLVQPLLYEAYM